MNTLKHVLQPTLATSVGYYLSNLFTSVKPKYSATDIAAAAAVSGNPAGA